MREMVVHGVGDSNLPGILFKLLIYTGVVSPVVYFVMVSATESHFGDEIQGSQVEVPRYHYLVFIDDLLYKFKSQLLMIYF